MTHVKIRYVTVHAECYVVMWLDGKVVILFCFVLCISQVEKGAKHWKIMDPKTNQLLTLIAFTEKQNDACRDTIKKLNERCD